MRIDVEKITPKQKLIIEKGLCDYCFIMNHWKDNDSDFQDVFYDFYLKARWAVMNKDGNRKPYFAELHDVSEGIELIEILEDLKTSMQNHNYEFSLASKLLHTRNPKLPIYDSKVREYLQREEGICFWWHQAGAPKGLSEIEKITHDWKELIKWYDEFLASEDGNTCVTWFDKQYPEHKSISNIKKIDFIIIATA